MKVFSKTLRIRPILLCIGTAVGCAFISSSAFSYDPSLPYRGRPGFQCLHYNSKGECMDFVFSNNGRTSNNGTSSLSNAVTGDNLTMELESVDGATVSRGDTVEFRIRLTNDTNRRVTTDVRAFLDDNMIYSSASDSGRLRSSREVEWSNVSVPAGDDVDVNVRVRISSSARTGDRLTIEAESDDSNEQVSLDVKVGSTLVIHSGNTCSVVYQLINGRRVTSTINRARCINDNNDNGSYSISISDTPDPFEPGELVNYTITIRNEDDLYHTFDAKAFLDDSTLYVSASDFPDLRGDSEVDWNDLTIGANGIRTITMALRTDRLLDDGDTIQLRFQAGSDEETETSEAIFR